MTDKSPGDITRLLIAWGKGNQEAFAALVPLVGGELHRLAARYMAGERQGHVLQPTALVNEAFLRLVDWKSVQWAERAHFFAMAATMMRRVLVDYARAEGREKRGGGAARVPLSGAEDLPLPQLSDVIALDAALTELERIAPRPSRVIELRYFGGLSLQETAAALHVSVGTVRRDWSLARAWLFRELSRH